LVRLHLQFPTPTSASTAESVPGHSPSLVSVFVVGLLAAAHAVLPTTALPHKACALPHQTNRTACRCRPTGPGCRQRRCRRAVPIGATLLSKGWAPQQRREQRSAPWHRL